MIILYILTGAILFLILVSLSVLFIRLKVVINGEYRQRKPRAEIDIYWIKYVFGARCKISDLKYVKITLWLLGIPIPFRLPLSHKKATPASDTLQDKNEPRFAREASGEKKTKEKFIDKIEDLLNTKDNLIALWQKYQVYIKKIYVRYITYSFESFSANIGLREPSQTGTAAAIVYSILPMTPLQDVNIQWDFQQPGLDVSLSTKITMKLYGIFCTLLYMYLAYRKDTKHECK